MKKLIKRISSRPIGRYLFIGGIVYAFELAVIIITQHMGASPILAVGISFWLGLILSFILQKFITFTDSRLQRGILLPQIVAFSFLVLFNFGFSLLVTSLLSPQIPATVSRTIALGVTTLWNFYLYKTKIFNRNDQPIY